MDIIPTIQKSILSKLDITPEEYELAKMGLETTCGIRHLVVIDAQRLRTFIYNDPNINAIDHFKQHYYEPMLADGSLTLLTKPEEGDIALLRLSDKLMQTIIRRGMFEPRRGAQLTERVFIMTTDAFKMISCRLVGDTGRVIRNYYAKVLDIAAVVFEECRQAAIRASEEQKQAARVKAQAYFEDVKKRCLAHFQARLTEIHNIEAQYQSLQNQYAKAIEEAKLSAQDITPLDEPHALLQTNQALVALPPNENQYMSDVVRSFATTDPEELIEEDHDSTTQVFRPLNELNDEHRLVHSIVSRGLVSAEKRHDALMATHQKIIEELAQLKAQATIIELKKISTHTISALEDECEQLSTDIDALNAAMPPIMASKADLLCENIVALDLD